MLNLKEKELFDKKISIINNKRFRDSFIASQQSDINDWDVGLVALWNTPVLFYELKKAYPNKKFYYVETEDLKDVYGVDTEDTIYIKEEEELAEIMSKFRKPKLIINPPYSIGGKIVAKCMEVYPTAKYSILMPLAQYKTAKIKNHKLYEYINTIDFVGGDGFDAVITENNAIVTLTKKPDSTKTYLDYMLDSCDKRYKEFYSWNILNNKGLAMERRDSKSNTPLPDISLETDFIETGRCCTIKGGAGFGTNGYGYKWNVLRKDVENEWLHCMGVIHFKTKQEKDNFANYWYAHKKFEGIASNAWHYANVVSVSSSYYYVIPQIDWDSIHINQKALWDQGLYDEAVLAEMGLKWDGDTIVKETN